MIYEPFQETPVLVCKIYMHNELLSNKFETPDVNFNIPDVRLDVQLPLALLYFMGVGYC